jgi:hypothetical protein
VRGAPLSDDHRRPCTLAETSLPPMMAVSARRRQKQWAIVRLRRFRVGITVPPPLPSMSHRERAANKPNRNQRRILRTDHPRDRFVVRVVPTRIFPNLFIGT